MSMYDGWQKSMTSDRAEHFFPEGADLSVARVWREQSGAWAWQFLQADNGPWQEEPSREEAKKAVEQALSLEGGGG